MMASSLAPRTGPCLSSGPLPPILPAPFLTLSLPLSASLPLPLIPSLRTFPPPSPSLSGPTHLKLLSRWDSCLTVCACVLARPATSSAQ
eukprot:356934-Rhodomonas_salina.1